MRWWHATPDVTTLMFCFFSSFDIFVMMLWSLMRCNQVWWVYTYLRGKKLSVFNTMKMLLLFLGERLKTWPQCNFLIWLAGHYQAMFLASRVAGHGSGLGLFWWDICALPPMAGENYCITSSASLFPLLHV